MYDLLLDTLEKPVLLFDADTGSVNYINTCAMMLFACQAIPKRLTELFAASEQTADAGQLMEFSKKNTVLSDCCFSFTGADGKRRYSLLYMSNRVVDNIRQSLCVFDKAEVFSEDKGPRKEQYYEMFLSMFDGLDEIVYVTDPKTSKILFANKKLKDIAGVSLLDKTCYQAIYNRDKVCDFCPRDQLLEDDMPVGKLISSEMRSPVTEYYYMAKDRLIPWINGKVAHFRSCVDITRQKDSEEVLIQLAQTDKMTGIFARDYGLERLGATIIAAKQKGGKVAVCFVDVDGLKVVNDTYGHAEGDKLLVFAVDMMRDCIRSTDMITRLGGDEFLLMLHGCDIVAANRVAGNIHSKFAEFNQRKCVPYTLAVSIGVYEIELDKNESVDMILNVADSRMYEQKKKKKTNRGRRNEQYGV